MLAPIKRQLIRLASVGFLLRALVPAGFMPASPADGGPIVVCHGGLAGAVLVELAASARDRGRDDSDRGESAHGSHGAASHGDVSAGHASHGDASAGHVSHGDVSANHASHDGDSTNHAWHGDAAAHSHGQSQTPPHGGADSPASLADGTVAEPAGGESHPHAGGDATGGLHGAWDNCPVGSLLVTAAILDDVVDVPLLDLAHVLIPRAPFAPVDVPATAPYDARGPPAPIAH